MVKSLYEKLNEIRKEVIKEKDIEKRLEKLKKVCSDENILNDALELAKHESTPFSEKDAEFMHELVLKIEEKLPDGNSKM
jgi:hypothetical protein